LAARRKAKDNRIRVRPYSCKIHLEMLGLVTVTE